MQLSDLKSEIRFITKSDTSSFTDDAILTGINIHIGELIQDILRVQSTRNTQGNMVYRDFTSISGLKSGDTGYNGEYPFPNDMLRPTRVEVSYDGLTWTPCEVYDIKANQNSEFNVDEINNSFLNNSGAAVNPSTVTPYVRFMWDSFFVRPLNTGNTIPSGIVVWYEQRQSALVNASDVPPFEANFHDLLVLKGAMRYAKRYPEKFNAMWKSDYDNLHAKFVEFYKNRFKSNLQMKVNGERFN